MGIFNIFKKNTSPRNSGYSNSGASVNKKALIGWVTASLSPKQDIDDNLDILRQRSRDIYMGSAPIGTGAIKTLRTKVVGSGLRLKSNINAEILGISHEEAARLERQIENEFALWADNKLCDAAQKNTFYELQQLAFISQILSGDAFVLLPSIKHANNPYSLSVQIIEADRVRTPASLMNKKNVVSGIELGKYGEAVAYYICDGYEGEFNLNAGKGYVRVPAYGKKTGLPNVLQLMESERPEQTRGVPILAPVIESLKQLGRYTDAELMAAVVSAFYTIFIETSENTSAENIPAFGESISPEQRIDDGDLNSFELGPGSVVELEPGEKANATNPGRPNTAFDGFVIAICRQIGTALEIPYELLVKQFNSSYSASRAALLEAWDMFKMRRKWLINDFCQPIYEQWLAEAVAIGRINAPGFFADPLIRMAYCGSEWNGPVQGQLDPLKEVAAAQKRVDYGFSTRARETVELTGGSFNQNVKQLEYENKILRKTNY